MTLAHLLSLLPSKLTGRAAPEASRQLRGWTSTSRGYRWLQYSKSERLLIWGAQHPLKFVSVIAISAWLIAAILVYGPSALPPQALAISPSWLQAVMPLKLARAFNAESDAGVAWGVQSTLVALLYPFVVSFVALLVQQRSRAPSAVRVYLLDSRALPGGASSVALLVVMGLQQFLLPFLGDSNEGVMAHVGPWLLVSNAIWLTSNIALSSVFLIRTLQFLQDEERSRSYTRVALNVVLPMELRLSIQAHIIASAPWVKWGYAPPSDWSRLSEPQVHMLGSTDGNPEVRSELRQPSVLEDIHLRILQAAAHLWKRRAKRVVQGRGRDFESPTLHFLPFVGEQFTGATVLARVQGGPPLSALERFLVGSAYRFRAVGKSTSLTLRTKGMLQELAGEVVGLMDQGRHVEARDFLAKPLIELHKTLLGVCSADDGGIQGSVATIPTSPHAWSHKSWDKEWLEAYREIVTPAVNAIELDRRVFSTLAHLPGILARALPAHPEIFLLHALETAAHLQWRLGQWWTNQLPTDGPAMSVGSTDVRLVGRAGRTYEEAVVDFLSGWGYLRPSVPRKEEVGDEEYWLATTARCRLLLRHLEHSATFYIEAILRGDGASAAWFHDHFLKWDYQQVGREDAEDDLTDLEFRHLGLESLSKRWAEAQTLLGPAVSMRSAESAALAIVRRYWDAMRIYLIHLLAHFSGAKEGSLALRYCGLLLKANPVRDGGRVRATSIESPDALLENVLQVDYGDREVRERLDRFAEELSSRRESLRVALWMYSIVGSVPEFQSMVDARAKLLAAMCEARDVPSSLEFLGRFTEPKAPRSTRAIQRHWRDLPTLQRIEVDLRDLQTRFDLPAFEQEHSAVQLLQQALDKVCDVQDCRAAAVAFLRALLRRLRWEYEVTLASRPVSPALLELLTRELSERVFCNFTDAFVEGVAFDRSSTAAPFFLTLDDSKRSYTESEAFDLEEHAERLAVEIRARCVEVAFARFVGETNENDCISVALPEDDEDTSEASAFLLRVIAACERFSAAGVQPIVVVPRTRAAWAFRIHRWNPKPHGRALPEGVSISKGDAARGELSVINGTSVFELPATLNANAYVVRRDKVRVLRVGGERQRAVTYMWKQISTERVEVTFAWKVEFRR